METHPGSGTGTDREVSMDEDRIQESANGMFRHTDFRHKGLFTLNINH